MMLSKEDYVEKIVRDILNGEMKLEDFVFEHFELKEKYSKILDDVHDYRYETHCMKLIIKNICKHFGVESEKDLQNIYLNKPYKFEDLKDGMWVYNKKNKDIIQCYPHVTNHNVQCVKYDSWIDESGDYMESYEEFEEDCFFPVWCANLKESED